MQYRYFKNLIKYYKFRSLNIKKDRFECPICNYRGPFIDITPLTGLRKHAKCPKCSSLERHRLQYLVLMDVFDKCKPNDKKILHFAPEKMFKNIFIQSFKSYESADLSMKGVDHLVNLEDLPFEDGVYDFIFASHVLEHVQNDNAAIKEIHRVLKPEGVAILPVPIVSEITIEYPEANPNEAYHVRAPGKDYYKRYDAVFSKISIKTSDDFLGKYQLYTYEDRSSWPTEECPLRSSMIGEKHIDICPVCYK